MKIIDKIKALRKQQIYYIIFGILLFVFGIYEIITNDTIISKGVTVNAIIIDTDMKSDYLTENEHDGRNDYDIVYEYNGKSYKNSVKKAKCAFLT